MVFKKQKQRGRPRTIPYQPPVAEAPRRKLKLKSTPKDACELYSRVFGSINCCAIYGVDEFTKALIDHLWKNPKVEFISCSDPNQDKLANINREISQRSHSLYRWEIQSNSGFIENCIFPVLVVAKAHLAEAQKRNINGLQLVVLDDL